MNELMHRQAEKSRQEQQKWQSARAEAEALTPEQVRSLEAQLRKTPEDGAVREKLMLRYYLDKDVRSNNRHILWAIAHQPLGELPRPIEPLHDKASYDEGKKLWLEHISEPACLPTCS